MSDDLFSVQDRVVLVSGGSRGIGLALAQACRERGARVIVSARHEDTLRATGLPYECCDVADPEAVDRTVGRVVQQHGRLDVLYNVAGINFRHAAATFPVERLDEILAVNLRGSYLMAAACGRVMVAQRRGKVVNIASLHTSQSLPGVSAYAASKGAIGSLTRALAVEWAPANVQVNALAPGFIETDLNRKLWEHPAMRGWAEGRTPAGRLGVPADLVGAALFLASAASDFVTGVVLDVDGGYQAGSAWPLEYPG
jgi:NAD(P)-dependent dehydrogenase (short-subunit alcohol dehydrogenase family)